MPRCLRQNQLPEAGMQGGACEVAQGHPDSEEHNQCQQHGAPGERGCEHDHEK